MKILVTGSNGTIGTQLCLDFLKKGLEVAELIQKNLSKKNKINTENSRTGEVTRYVGNIDKLRRAIGFKPLVNF